MRTCLQRKAKKVINYATNKKSKTSRIKAKITKKIKRKKENMTEINIENIIQTMPNFDGKKEKDIEFFISQFDQLAAESKMTDKLKLILLKAKLTGEAREIMINTTELNESNNYAEFKTKIVELLKPTVDFQEVQEKFMQLKQKPDQSIEEFTKLFNISASKYLKKSGHSEKPGAKDLLDTIKLSKFLDAIRPDIALEVRKSGPKGFTEAIESAKKIESALKTIPAEAINTTSTNETQLLCETLIEMNKKQSEEITHLKEQINAIKLSNNQEQPQSKFCAICDTKTHNTNSCWYNQKNKTNVPTRGKFNFQNRTQKSFGHHNTQYYPFQNFMTPVFNHNLPAYNNNPNYAHNYMANNQPNNMLEYTQNQSNYVDNNLPGTSNQTNNMIPQNNRGNNRRFYKRGNHSKSPKITFPQEN